MQCLDSFANRLFEPVALLQMLFDQVRDNFGVGFGNEVMIFLSQFIF